MGTKVSEFCSPKQPKLLYINGSWVPAQGGELRVITNPGTGEELARVAEGDSKDVDLAVQAARIAFEQGPWRTTKAVNRGKFLLDLANALEARAAFFAELDCLDNGKPLRETEFDVADGVTCLRYYAGLATKPHGQTFEVADEAQSMTVREPIGVCGLIVPWNYPLLMAIWKLAPALAAGNTVVFKPSELTPLSAIALFELIHDLGLPPGVANLVMGAGPRVGGPLAAHMDVDKISFTGGTTTGRSIMQAAIGNLKKISLELGGKSPNIVFADADLEHAVDWALFAIFANQGQVCSAGSRLLLEESIHDAFVERLAQRAKTIKVGPGHIPGIEMGALISKPHMEKVLAYIDRGLQEGATLVCGGRQITQGACANGWFVEPTIFKDTKPSMTIVREEIFGPVLVIQKFSTESEALSLANDSIYGLAGAVFTKDGARALRVIKGLRAGITWVNAYHPTYSEAPWGGYKQSGFGRDLGTYGYDEYTQVKQINIYLDPQPIGFYGP